MQIQKECRLLLNSTTPTIRHLSRVLGLLESCRPAIWSAPLHYRHLQTLQITALQRWSNYNALISLTPTAKTDLAWWITALQIQQGSRIIPPSADLTISSDASKQGWGACWGTQRTGGCWSERESQDHINILELRAALFALKSFLPSQTNRVVCLKMDNTTAVAYLHNMGGTHCPQTIPPSIGGLGLVREEEYISSSTAHPGQDKYGALDLTTSTTTTTSTRFDRVRGNYRSRFRFHSNVAFIAVNQQREKTFHKLNLLRTKIPYKTCK